MNYKKNKKGFTLVELLISVLIFSLIIGGIVNVLLASVSLQRRIMREQKMFSDVSFVLEYMSRTLRMARKDINGVCLVGLRNHNYELRDGERTIRFLNFDGQCQEFSLRLRPGTTDMAISERIASTANVGDLLTAEFLPITSTNIIVTSMHFDRAGSDWHSRISPDSPLVNQSRVAIAMVVEPRGGGTGTRFQTVISQRQLNVVF